MRLEVENTLQYFPDRRVLRRLAAVHGETFESLADDFATSLKADPTLANWMRDVLDVVEPAIEAFDDEDETVASNTSKPAAKPEDILELVASLVDLDGQWSDRHDRFRSNLDWLSVPPASRPAMVDLLQSHPDPAVRCVGAYALAAWNETDTLLAMIDDPNPSVSKSHNIHTR